MNKYKTICSIEPALRVANWKARGPYRDADDGNRGNVGNPRKNGRSTFSFGLVVIILFGGFVSQKEKWVRCRRADFTSSERVRTLPLYTCRLERDILCVMELWIDIDRCWTVDLLRNNNNYYYY